MVAITIIVIDEDDEHGIKGEFTLFAPTDLAFNEFLQKLGGVKVVSFLFLTA